MTDRKKNEDKEKKRDVDKIEREEKQKSITKN